MAGVVPDADNRPFPTLPADEGGQRSSVVNCVAYSFEGRRLRDTTLDEISDVLAGPDTFVWLGLHEPNEPLLRKIQEEFGLHDLAIEDAQHAHQRPKIEVYDDTLFIVVHTSQFVAGKVQFGETHIFLGKRFLVTVRHGASLSYARARASSEQAPEMLALGPSFCLYSVLDFIVDNYFPIVGSFETELKELERQIFKEKFDGETIRRLYTLKRELVTLRLAVTPMQDILNQLGRFFPALIHEEVRLHFRDIFDHALRVSEATSTLGEMISAALQVNLSMVTVGQNQIVKSLAGWGAILAIPTTVGSIYGMNFDNMPELKWHYGYFGVMALTTVVCLILYWRLKRAGWL